MSVSCACLAAAVLQLGQPAQAQETERGARSGTGAAFGQAASDEYRQAFFEQATKWILSKEPLSDIRPCSPLETILTFINEEIRYVDPGTGAEKTVPAVKAGRKDLEEKLNDGVANTDVMFVSNESWRSCIKAKGGEGATGVAAALAVTAGEKRLMARVCKRAMGDPKKDAIMILGDSGAEEDSPVSRMGTKGAHELLHLVLYKMKARKMSVHHGLTDWLYWGRAATTNTIPWKGPEKKADCGR
ncbi:MAG: hypothetical protein HY927_14765 [Elusimicrobia bacterium]|nr:hypothetical protein [Elusimicrobiota bacterium]